MKFNFFLFERLQTFFILFTFLTFLNVFKNISISTFLHLWCKLGYINQSCSVVIISDARDTVTVQLGDDVCVLRVW